MEEIDYDQVTFVQCDCKFILLYQFTYRGQTIEEGH